MFCISMRTTRLVRILLESDVGGHSWTRSKTDTILAVEALDLKNSIHGDCVEWKPWGMETKVRNGWIGE